MHEWSIAASLRRMVEERARAERAVRVLAVAVRVGDAAGVDAGLLATAWEGVREGGLVDGASLALERVPARWACALCGRDVDATGPLRCNACDAPAVLAGGEDLHLVRIELERAHGDDGPASPPHRGERA